MCLQPAPIGPVPAETARVARAAFPNGNRYLALRDVLGPLYDDASFAPLCARRGRPAEAPWRLALVTVRQFADGRSDRQAAAAVRSRIDGKYVLGLELTAPGFDFSVLSAVRVRLVQGGAAQLLRAALLAACRAHGDLTVRGQQRTDATQVRGALRCLSRVEQLGETRRAPLHARAAAAPAWLGAQVPADWFGRSGRRIAGERLPQGPAARQASAETVGRDGSQLLATRWAPTAPPARRRLPAGECLRRMWLEQDVRVDDQGRLRTPQELPPASAQRRSPSATEARYGRQGPRDGIGDTAHRTETCAPAGPHLVTQVTTPAPPASDGAQLAGIQADLARRDRLPAVQWGDGGSLSGGKLVASQRDHQLALVGPLPADPQWPARNGTGVAAAAFVGDWATRVVTCPQGRQRVRWQPVRLAHGQPRIRATFAAPACTPGPVRARCTRARSRPRRVTFPPQDEYAMMQAARAPANRRLRGADGAAGRD